MWALCLMLSVTYYAQNYAGIIGWSQTIAELQDPFWMALINRRSVIITVKSPLQSLIN